jgi:hypothetical protein
MYEAGVVRDGLTVMLHYNRNNRDSARMEAAKHGRVLFCRKANRDLVIGIGNIEYMRLDDRPVQVKTSPYRSAIAMDELIGQKRNVRRNNQYKDKIDS